MSGYQQALKKSMEMTKDLSREQLNMHIMYLFAENQELKEENEKLKRGHIDVHCEEHIKLQAEIEELKEENEKLKEKVKQMKKYVNDMFEEREHCAMYCCRMCNGKRRWDEIDENHTCEDCIFDIDNQYYGRDFYEPVHDPDGELWEEIFIKD